MEELRNRRIRAAFVDIAVVLGALIVLGIAAGQAEFGDGTYGVWLSGFPALMYALLAFAYFFILEWGSGQTLGKAWQGLRVTNSAGALPSVWQVALRTVLRVIDWIPAFYLVGYISVRLTGDGARRIGDLAARTQVTEASPVKEELSPRIRFISLLLVAGTTFGLTLGWSDHEADFASSADPICERFTQEADEIQADLRNTRSPGEAVPFLSELLALSQRTELQLAALSPPDSLRPDWEEFMIYVRRQTELVGRLLRAAKRDDLDTLRAVQERVSENTMSLSEVLDGSGLEDCA